LAAPQRLQLLRRRGARIGLATGDDHIGPALDQPLGDGQPDAARTAGNYGAAASEIEKRVQRILVKIEQPSFAAPLPYTM